MGIVFSFCFGETHISRENDYKIEAIEEKKTYSWDKKDKIDPKQFMFDGLKDQTVRKLPGEIDGQQFIIQNCQNCNIYLFDHSATVTIDDCIDCKIFVGPCKGSVFVRDCVDLQLAVICQQFRTRDCKNFDTFLFCQTQPIIESSQNMRFACLQLTYPTLQGQFNSSGLITFNNSWSKIHDFTPAGGSNSNFSLTTQMQNKDVFQPLENADPGYPDIQMDKATSLIPLTLGKSKRPSKEMCFVLVFSEDNDSKSAKIQCQNLLKDLLHDDGCFLVSSTAIKMHASDAERITCSKSFNDLTEKGDAVGLEFCGDNVTQVCREVITKQGISQAVHVADGDSAKQQLEIFTNFIQMQTSV